MSDSFKFKKAQPPVPETGPGTTGSGDGALTPQAPATVELLGENEIALVKNGKRHVFACPPGEEAELLNQFAAIVTDPQSELTWFDAAVLSHQLGERMSKRVKDLAQRQRSA